jgi:hypothetical protein
LTRPESWLAAGMTVVLALQLLLGYRLDLYSDEIFYWQAATRPALAYSDLPFMTALLAGLGTQLGINHALAVRLPFILLGTLLPLLVVWLARPMVGRQQAVEAGLLALCIPLAGFAGLLAVPDVPLLCFGIVAIGYFDRGMRTDHLLWWLAGGTAAALGFSTHYRFLPYGAAALAFLVLFPAGRAQWRKPGLWLAASIAATGLLPILWFNLNHDLSGLGYHLLERHPWEFQWIGFLHVFKQALLVTPPLYIVLLITLWRMWQRARQGHRESQLLLCFALANLLPYLLLAPWADSTRTSIHWPLSGYLPVLVFLPECLRWLQTSLQTRLASRQARQLVLAIPLLGFAGTLVAFIGVGSQAWHDRLQPWLGDNTLSNKMAGWKPFSTHTAHLLELQFPNGGALVITDNYYTAAQVEFGIEDRPTTYTTDNDKALRDGRISQFAIWQRDARALIHEAGRDALFITEDSTLTVPEKQAVLADICRRVARVRVVDQLSLLHGEKRFTYYRLSGILPEPLPPVSAMAGCPHPPQAWIDRPQSNAEVAGVLLIEGWVFNEGVGLREVRVILDDRIVGIGDYGLPRPDVAEVMGVLTDPNSPNLGFSLTLDTVNLAPGEHSLALELVSNSGEIQRYGDRRIKIRKD